jgi:hypothetical protein
MATASTSFMAAPGAFSSLLASKLDKIDCSQVLAAVLKADRQLLGHIKMGPTARNIEFNWIEDELHAVQFEGYTSVSGSIIVVGFDGSASLWGVAREGALVVRKDPYDCTPSAHYVMRVSSVTGASTLITASYGSTTYTTASCTATWYVISQPYGDSSDASTDISRLRTKKRNFTQIFERAIEITQSRKGMDMEAVVDELQYQIKNRTLEIKRELDLAVLYSRAYASGSTVFTGDLDERTFNGIIEYLRDPDMDRTREDTTVTDGAGAALTVALINNLLYTIWDAGGLDETADPIILVGAAQQRVISGMEKDIRRVEQGERQVGYYRDIFLSDMGTELPIVLDRWVQEDKLIVLDRSRVALRALSGDEWHMEKMAKTGRNEKWQLSGQYGLEIRNPDACHGMILNLSG